MPDGPADGLGKPARTPQSVARRYFGTVTLDPTRPDPTRVGRDAARVAEEVIAHLAAQAGAEVSVTLEFAVRLPNGVNA